MNHKPYWTAEEKETALTMRKQGFRDIAIAARLGRTTKAVNAFLADPSRHRPNCKRDLDHHAAAGEPIGECPSQLKFEKKAREGSQKLLEAMLAVLV